MTEDSGTGLTNRTTETLEFHVSGKATLTRDALGREFETVYDGDGNVLSVTRTDTTPDVPVATYTYGTTDSDLENGQLVQVVDELSGVEQGITYVQSGVAVGMPDVVTETNGSDSYTVDYDYSSLGDREYVTYDVGGSETRWHYDGYATYGFGTSPARVFSRMNRQAWTGSAWVDSGEEFAYAYDDMGRLLEALFAQTPRSGETDYSEYSASSRALATYEYDPGGRVEEVAHWWQAWDNLQSQYVTSEVLGSSADYAYYLGLKSSTSFYEEDSGDWSLVRTETYSYDSQTDWLTGVDYNDGLSNEVATWSYDAAGNRVSDSANSGTWSYDALNRMTASPFGTYTNDLLGNRTGFDYSGSGAETYEWDLLNRMVEHWPDVALTSSDYVAYTYRADGMRVRKVDGYASPTETTDYFYDGQMGVQDTHVVSGGDTTVTKYGVGARGIDVITKKVNSGSEVFGYPVYDTHGNMVATLARSGSNSYSVGNVQWYDVWGGIRSGSSTEDQGYVANLGHRRDGESGLIYMRARYYEPGTGRFVSEDLLGVGRNWYCYAENKPTFLADRTGNSPIAATFIATFVLLFIGGLLAFGVFCHLKIEKIDALLRSLDAKDYRDGFQVYEYTRDLSKRGELLEMRDSYKMRRNLAFGAAGTAIVALIGYAMFLDGMLMSLELDGYGIDVFEYITFG